ncbi:aminotransferase class I/II-fold pyridoxal phosphate-dependent enzyme [Shewanella sp. A3A]|nr:aminotransferase class I/II-fold pyridoxal phosphate-dependent enzyme [Shewanella ferrihydritica]
MAKSDAPNTQRRQFLKLSGALAGGAALTGLSSVAVAKSSEASKSFTPPTADKPIRICWNENPLGMSPKAQEVARATVTLGNRYPMGDMVTLQKMLADEHGVPADYVLLTAGATEGIRAAVEALASPDVQLVVPELTFDAAEEGAKVNGITKITRIPMLKDWGIDLAAMKKAVADYNGPSLVYLVNPNNPTGAIVKAGDIEAWINSKPANTMFLMDEAYAEFADDPNFRSVSPLLKAGAQNIVLLKTFSKLFAMAGMRVGWVVSTPEVIAKIRDKTASNMLNFPAVKAAIASLEDKPFIAYSRQSNETARKILLEAFHKLNIEYVPSNTNFIFQKLDVPLKDYQEHMKQAGILVGRAFPPADEYCRVSLGTPEEMTFVAQTLLDFRKKGWV